jgi:hypothetical protein
MIGLDCYDAKSKEHHRRWAANRIIELLSVPIRDAVLLYLIGPEDVDGTVFLSKGFRANNLISVDLSAAAITRIRADGRSAINDNVLSVLANWNDRPLDVLHLDTCSTYSTCSQMLNNAHKGGAIDQNTVIYCNMQRGRERHFGRNRQRGEHRGMLLYKTDSWRVSFMEAYKKGILDWPACASMLWCDERESQMREDCRPVFASYRSSRVFMDSVVMRALPRPYIYTETGIGQRTAIKTRRKLAALMAVRTKRARCESA